MREILGVSPIIPVAVLQPNANEIKIAQTLVLAGIPVIEVTLRTPGAIEKISAITDKVPSIVVGAGTVWSADEAQAAINAGVKFIVSPAYVASVHKVCDKHKTPYLPGVQTVTEAASCVSHGLNELKLFPANIAGGPAVIKAISSVLPETTFCPTGGISLSTAPEYLQLANVPCVGGSWVLNAETIESENWIKLHADIEQSLAHVQSS